ncbi:MAG: hypothetical protein OEV87_09590 [Phycisphaerae bacterium]|nr:hypothetical protein [Phycisphaerae bacterium]
MNDRETLRYYDRPDQRPDIRAGLEALKDRVLNRAGALEAEQRALLTAILDQGSSYRQVARLRGEHASTVSRRFRRLLRKLSQRTGGKTGIQARNLKAMDKTVLTAYYLFGMNQLQIAARLGISRYRVRKTLDQFAAQQRSGALVLRSSKSEEGSRPIASDTVKCTGPDAARSITVAAQKRSVPCTR